VAAEEVDRQSQSLVWGCCGEANLIADIVGAVAYSANELCAACFNATVQGHCPAPASVDRTGVLLLA